VVENAGTRKVVACRERQSEQARGYDAQVKSHARRSKATALTDTYAEQWLHLRSSRTAPEQEFFPTFTQKLTPSMGTKSRTLRHLAATTAIHGHARRRLHLRERATSSVTTALKGLPVLSLKKVMKLPDPNSGGLVGMSAVLAMTSHTTAPARRFAESKYVLDVILRHASPAPRRNVGNAEDAKGPKEEAKTFARNRAARDRTECAGPREGRPARLRVENFDAIGRFRKSAAT